MSFHQDVIIVGGGVIGLAIARELHKRGVRKISVFDRVTAGREASWAAAGILAPQVEADLPDDFFRLCYESNRMYRAFADALLEETAVDIDLDQTGTLFVRFDDEDASEIRRRLAWQTKAGLAIKHLDARETLAMEPGLSPRIRESLLFPDDGQVENRKLIEALVRYASLNGIEIVQDTGVQSIAIENGAAAAVVTPTATYQAGLVVLAAGAWTASIKIGATVLPLMVKPIRGQMISYHPAAPICRHVVYSRGGYLVPRSDGRLLVGATSEDAGFDKSLTGTGINDLKAAAAEMAPALNGLNIDDQWAGLRPFIAGGRPVIGRVPSVDGLFAAVGHFRNGVLLTPITARLIADAVTIKSHEFLAAFGFPDAETHQITGHF